MAQERKAPKTEDKAKQQQREINRKKRLAKLADLKAKHPLRYAAALNYREAKENGLCKTWPEFCAYKAKAYSDYWTELGKKPAMSEKTLERKKTRLAKLRELMAKLETEVG